MNNQTDKSESIGGNLNIGGRLTAGGNALFTRNVRIEGWLDAPNLRSPCQGMYESIETLTAAHPEPLDGWWALVSAPAAGCVLQATLFTASGGEWTAGDTITLDFDIDLSSKADTADLDTKADRSMFVTLSEEEYNALSEKDENVYYFIYE